MSQFAWMTLAFVAVFVFAAGMSAVGLWWLGPEPGE